MRASRRTFLKIAGLTLVGLGIKPTVDVLAGSEPRTSAAQVIANAPSTPAPIVGKRWAMVVDVPKCLQAGDCTDCITACHTAHNVPHFTDPKEEVKWIWKESFENAFPDEVHQYVTASLKDKPIPIMCNHCDNPACVRVCPTQATWKGEGGIVMMDMHRCIGCRFCLAACPYGSRSFNWKDPRLGLDVENLNPDFPTRTRGVVEKCNFCVDRLANGLMPACVEACKAKALAFGDMEDAQSPVRKILEARYSLVRKPSLGTKPQVYYTL